MDSPWNSPDQNTGVGSLSLLQGIFPTQGLNPGLPHCRCILYQLNHKRNPRVGSLSLLQGIFLELNQGLLHRRQILYQLSCQGSLVEPLLSTKCCLCCYRVQNHASKRGLVLCFCRGQDLRRFQDGAHEQYGEAKRYDTER